MGIPVIKENRMPVEPADSLSGMIDRDELLGRPLLPPGLSLCAKRDIPYVLINSSLGPTGPPHYVIEGKTLTSKFSAYSLK